ncbi:hypothetical protein J2125_002783 [Erwinia toletana]|uniref:Uncharacterized protein n=1 Tax=Winslowiella toletana TaxID=92490 RepID=A0ABS4PAC8_9GAMM|nr:hypothetical protein [Winslowiella toletana]MBP2169591.1 hypothetical protein [Winslowiella toletana]
MAIQLGNGGGLSPGILSDIKMPPGAQSPAASGQLSLKKDASTISYGGSGGGIADSSLLSGKQSSAGQLSQQNGAGMLQGMLMLLGMQALMQSMGAGNTEGAQAEATALPEESAAGSGTADPNIRSSEKDLTVKPSEENLQGRPVGDNRTADQIIDDNPVLKNLGDQKDIKRDELKQRFGDWTEDNKDPKSRADAAYNMSCVLNSIKGLNGSDGSERTEISANDKIEGITKDGDARHGTEAGVLKDVAEQGLKMLPDNKNLPETSDTHVRKDGTNKDNFQWGMGEIGKVLSNIPILKSVLAPTFNNIGEARDLGEVFTGGLKGLGEGALSAARGPVGWGITAATDTVQIAMENANKDKKDPPPFS